VKNSFDPKENIEGGVKYLKFLQDTFNDDILTVAAYNAGEGAVVKYGGVPPYRETIDYVAKVSKKLGDARKTKTAIPRPQPAVEVAGKLPEEQPHRPLAQYVDAEGRVHLVTR
jgi:Transglycosylase SLT domain